MQPTRWDKGFSASGYQSFLAHTRRHQARQEVRVRGIIHTAPQVIGADDYQTLLDACRRFIGPRMASITRMTRRLPAPAPTPASGLGTTMVDQ